VPKRTISRREVLRMGAMAGVGLAIAACAPATAPAQAPAQANTPQAEGAGGYQGKFVILSAGNPEQNAPLIQAIEDAHPGVQVDWRGLTSERYTELFAAAEVAGDQIDIMDLNGQDLRRYAVGGKLKDLSDLDYLDRFRQVGLDTYTINGKLWALPRGGIAGFVFFYNKKALEKIGFTDDPATYTQLQEMAPQLKDAGYAPFTHPGKNIYLWPIWQFFAYAQTSGNDPVDKTWKTLQGDMKFTDPEHVEGLAILEQYTKDGMFIEGVNSLDSDGAWLTLTQGKAAFWYTHMGQVATYRGGDFPELDMSLVSPLRSVDDSNIIRQLPGGTGSADGIYANIAGERLDVAHSILDLMTSDKWVQWQNQTFSQPVSTNKNVQASDDPLALKFAEECAPNQFTYLDWYWPPEITRSFQENQQAIVAGTKNPDEAAKSIQDQMDQLYADGYKFET
jgi:raffinose/stachyose/melibiose transport system substrate-binding protein